MCLTHKLQLIDDDVPTTSGRIAWKNSRKNNFSRSPLQSDSFKKMQKICDDKARKLLKRSRLMIQDKHKSHSGIGNRSYLNTNVPKRGTPSKRNTTMKSTRRNKKRKVEQIDNLGPAEYAPKSDQNPKSLATGATVDTTNDGDSEDDCVIVEQLPSHVTILDDDDNDDSDDSVDSDDSDDSDDTDDSDDSSDNNAVNEQSVVPPINSSYQLFSKSFSRLMSSTPCGKNTNRDTDQSIIDLNHYNAPSFAEDAKNNCFVDVTSNAYLGKISYNTLSPLTGEKRGTNAKVNDSVVVLDDVSPNGSNNKTLKNVTNECDTSSSEGDDSADSSNEEGELIGDDSVVFVSVTNSNDFIPINNNNKDINPNKRKSAEASRNATETVQHYSNLLNKNEKRELQQYNSNTYNPNAGKILTAKKRMVIIDGSNVAFKHSADKEFSVKGLTIATEYFEKKGHEVKVVIPQYRMNQHKSTDPLELHRLHKAGNIVQTPCKNLPGHSSISYDDRFILQLASEMDAAIVSNDNYRDLMHENAAFKKIIETRVIGYTWCNDMFLLPKDPYGKWGPTLDMILYRS